MRESRESDRQAEPAGNLASESDERACARRILEVASDATSDEVRSAYRRLCSRYHPDRFANDPGKIASATQLLAEINRAYAVLQD